MRPFPTTSHRSRRSASAVALALAVLAGAACGSDDETGTGDDEATTTTVPSGPVAGRLDGAELGAPYLGALTFAWPRDCVVPVSETVLKDGKEAELTYRMELQGDGELLVVALEEVRVHRVDGEEVSGALQEAASAAFVIPQMVVDPAGDMTEVRGVDEAIARIAELDPRLARVADAPGFATILERSVGSKQWDVWAGSWASWGSFEEAEEVGFYEDNPDQEFDMTSLGTLEGGRAAFRRVEVISGAALAEQLGVVMGEIAEGMEGADPGAAQAALEDFEGERRTTVEVVTDPATLRPDSAYISVKVDATMDGDHRVQEEIRTTRFDWAGSDCA